MNYNHAFSIAFSVISKNSCNNDEDYPTPNLIREAILLRLASIDDHELMEAIGAPFDTFIEED